MRRNSSGAFGRFRPRWLLAWLVVLVITSSCSPSGGAPKFALSIRNAGDAPVHLKVIVASEGRPDRDLRIPAGSGILQTQPRAMDVKDGKADPVVIELYTDTCALLTSVTVGEGRTTVVIGADLSVKTTPASGDPGAGAVEPELVPAC